MHNNYREVAIKSLRKIELKNAYSNIVINNDVKKIGNSKYKNLYRNLVLGVIENKIFIDWIINQQSKLRVKKMQIDLIGILRLAVYQFFFMSSSEKIVVNESVELAKKKIGLKSASFANAVLRNILRNKDNLISKLKSKKLEDYYSIKYSYPLWLIERWIKQFGTENLKNILESNNSKAPLNVRVNTLKIDRESLIDKLNKKNNSCIKTKFANEGITILNPNNIEKLDEYKNGLFSIQSESSLLVGQVLNPKENSLIIDVCSAPGGKSLHAAQIMNNKGKIFSRDLHGHKLNQLKSEINRLGINIICTEIYDALELDNKLINKADYCIVDVPCTGLGIIRRKPEIKYRKKEEDIYNLVKIQNRILRNAAKYLKPGGELVYSTCTTTKEENLEVINNFIKENNEFFLIDISEETNNMFDTSNKGYIEIYSHIHNIDGFFIAKLGKMQLS